MFRRYQILQCGDIEKLIKKRKTEQEEPIYYVCIENIYDVVLINMQSSPVTFQVDHCLSVPSHKVLYHTASKRAAEVAIQLLDIFLLFEAPAIPSSHPNGG